MLINLYYIVFSTYLYRPIITPLLTYKHKPVLAQVPFSIKKKRRSGVDANPGDEVNIYRLTGHSYRKMRTEIKARLWQ